MLVYPDNYQCLPITAIPLSQGGGEREEYCESDKECQRSGGDYRLLPFRSCKLVLILKSIYSIFQRINIADAPPPPSNVFSPMVCVMIAVTVWQGIKDVRCSV